MTVSFTWNLKRTLSNRTKAIVLKLSEACITFVIYCIETGQQLVKLLCLYLMAQQFWPRLIRTEMRSYYN